MKSIRLRVLILGAIVAVSIAQSSAYAFVDCGLQFFNNPGDILHGWAHWDYPSSDSWGDVRWQWSTTGGTTAFEMSFDPYPLVGGHPSTRFTFTARVFNEFVHIVQTFQEGPNDNVTCYMYDPVVDRIGVGGNEPGDTIKKWIKDRARGKVNDFRNARDILAGVSAATAMAGQGIVSLVALGQSILFGRAAERQSDIANDPPSECPGECQQTFSAYLHDSCELGCWIYDDPFGDGVIPYQYNEMLNNMLYADAWLEGAYQSANRASACALMPWLGCYDSRYYEMIWYMNNAGYVMENASGWTEAMSQRFYAEGYLEWVAGVEHDAAEQLWDAAQYLKEAN